MYVNKELIDKIEHIDIIKYAKEVLHIEFTSETLVSAQACCPHPDHDDHKPSFSIWKNRNGKWAWCCHSCHCGKNTQSHENHKTGKQNYGTSLIALIRWLSDYKGSPHIYTFLEAVKIAANYIGIDVSIGKNVANKTIDILNRNKAIASGCHQYLMKAKNAAFSYLLSRDLTTKDIIDWEIGFNGDRIVFPFKDREDNIIGFTQRVIGNDAKKSKYINSYNNEVFNKSSYLYGIDKVDENKNYLIVTEGQFDVIFAYKYGLTNTVATSGTRFTEKHAEFLRSKLPNIDKIIFIFDNDKAGMRGLEAGASVAREAGFMINCFILPDDMDLCDYLTKNKESGTEYILNHNIPYYYKEVEKELKEFNELLLNFQNRIAPKLNNILVKTKNKNERRFANYYFKKFFLMDLHNTNQGGEDNNELFINTG